MSDSSKFDPLQFEIIKKAIPFVADNTAELQDDADSELDFSITDIDDDIADNVALDVDKEAECEIEMVEKNFLEDSALRLSNISSYLTAWRTKAATEDVLDDIGREFHALKESAARAGFDDVSRLSHVVVSLLEQSDKLVSDDSSLLNLLEEMHDGLAAELGFISMTSENHLSALISMVQLLLADEFAPPIAITADAPEAYPQGEHHNQPQVNSGAGFAGECMEGVANPQVVAQEQDDIFVLTARAQDPIQPQLTNQIRPTTSQVLLVKVGTYQIALLMRTIERVMRVHEQEIQLLDGRYYIVLGGQQIPLINLATRVGEACIRADDSFRFLVVTRLQDSPSADGIVTDRMIAFEIDQFQETAEIVVNTPGSQLASMVGVVGVTRLADDSLVLVLDPEKLADREAFWL